MSFVYLPRKQPDVELHRKLLVNKKELNDEYQDKRSCYDKDLEKYNGLIKKLDSNKVDTIEYKNIVVDIEFYLNKLKTDKYTVSDVDVDVDDDDVVKPPSKQKVVKEKVVKEKVVKEPKVKEKVVKEPKAPRIVIK